MTQQRAIAATVMRGGTSRGLFFHAGDLPVDPAERDQLLLAAIGSPDPYRRQINGLGGATSSTSKVMIVAPSDEPDIDVEYTFGQVSIDRPVIDYSGNCGNLTAAVGPFAIEECLVSAEEPTTELTLFNTNTRKRIRARIQVCDGAPLVDGDYSIDGVPGSGARIALTWEAPGGPLTGRLLPSGRARDMLDVVGLGQVEVSIVDAANPVVFVAADRLGLTGTEQPAAIDNNPDLLATLERVREAAAGLLGFGDVPEALRVAFVAAPVAYQATDGATVEQTSVDLCARIISLGRAHHAYTMTGAICTAVAALVPGTVVAEVTRDLGLTLATVRIGHAAGTIAIGVMMESSAEGLVPATVTTFRTARRIMDGRVYVPARGERE